MSSLAKKSYYTRHAGESIANSVKGLLKLTTNSYTYVRVASRHSAIGSKDRMNMICMREIEAHSSNSKTR